MPLRRPHRTGATERTIMKELATNELKQERAILALLSEPTLGAVAKAASISDVTLWRWMKEPDFKARLRDARRAVVEGAIGRLQAAATEAVSTLQRNLSCGTPAVEVRAAATIPTPLSESAKSASCSSPGGSPASRAGRSLW